MRPGRAGWLLLLAAGCANLGELTSGSSTDGSAADVAAEAQGPDGSPTDAPMQDATDADGATEAHADATTSDADATTSDADATTSDEGATTPDSNPPDAPDASFTVGGTVTGLLAGQTVVLQDNGGSTLTVQGGATTFTFATTVPGGAPYSVTVLHQPAGELCTVGMGSGTASIALPDGGVAAEYWQSDGGDVLDAASEIQDAAADGAPDASAKRRGARTR